jgi:hypothetical protein
MTNGGSHNRLHHLERQIPFIVPIQNMQIWQMVQHIADTAEITRFIPFGSFNTLEAVFKRESFELIKLNPFPRIQMVPSGRHPKPPDANSYPASRRTRKFHLVLESRQNLRCVITVVQRDMDELKRSGYMIAVTVDEGEALDINR